MLRAGGFLFPHGMGITFTIVLMLTDNLIAIGAIKYSIKYAIKCSTALVQQTINKICAFCQYFFMHITYHLKIQRRPVLKSTLIYSQNYRTFCGVPAIEHGQQSTGQLSAEKVCILQTEHSANENGAAECYT